MKDFDNLKNSVLNSYLEAIDSRIEALYEDLTLLYILCEGLDVDKSYMDDYIGFEKELDFLQVLSFLP